MPRHTVWIVCELYHPDLTSTGWYITQLAEALASDLDVRIICAPGTETMRDMRTSATQLQRSVTIARVGPKSRRPDNLLARLLFALRTTAAMAIRAARSIERNDTVIVVTNPPMLPFAIAPICRARGARCILYIQDLYPDVLVGTGLVRPRSLTFRALSWMSQRLYDHVDRIVVDGRDAQALVAKRAGNPAKVRWVPYWADLDLVGPMPRSAHPMIERMGLADRFVVQFAGNMGRLHDLETILDAAALLLLEGTTGPGVHIVIRGEGARRLGIEQRLRARPLDNVTLADPVSQAELATMLGACDVGLIALVPDARGIAIPSRMYNILSSGRPIVAVADEDTELAMMVREEGVGWVVPPGDPAALARTLVQVSRSGQAVLEIGRHARRIAEERYSPERAFDAFRQCLREVMDHTPPAGCDRGPGLSAAPPPS